MTYRIGSTELDKFNMIENINTKYNDGGMWKISSLVVDQDQYSTFFSICRIKTANLIWLYEYSIPNMLFILIMSAYESHSV